MRFKHKFRVRIKVEIRVAVKLRVKVRVNVNAKSRDRVRGRNSGSTNYSDGISQKLRARALLLLLLSSLFTRTTIDALSTFGPTIVSLEHHHPWCSTRYIRWISVVHQGHGTVDREKRRHCLRVSPWMRLTKIGPVSQPLQSPAVVVTL